MPQEIKDIPNAFADNQDYDFSTVDDSKWQEVTVPSSLAMQGFNIESNTEYYYKRTVEIPESYIGKRILILLLTAVPQLQK